jgi:hypothetical protein
MCVHKVQEVTIVVNQDNTVFLRLFVHFQLAGIKGELLLFCGGE